VEPANLGPCDTEQDVSRSTHMVGPDDGARRREVKMVARMIGGPRTAQTGRHASAPTQANIRAIRSL